MPEGHEQQPSQPTPPPEGEMLHEPQTHQPDVSVTTNTDEKRETRLTSEQEDAKMQFSHFIDERSLGSAKKILETTPLPPDVIEEIVRPRFLRDLSKYGFLYADMFLEKFHITRDSSIESAVTKEAEEDFFYSFKKDELAQIVDLHKKLIEFGFRGLDSHANILTFLEDRIIHNLQNGHSETACDYVRTLGEIFPNLTSHPRIQHIAANQMLDKYLNRPTYWETEYNALRDVFNPSPEIIEQEAARFIAYSITRRGKYSIPEYSQFINPSSPLIQQAVKRTILDEFQDHSSNSGLEYIQNSAKILPDLLSEADIQKAVKEDALKHFGIRHLIAVFPQFSSDQEILQAVKKEILSTTSSTSIELSLKTCPSLASDPDVQRQANSALGRSIDSYPEHMKSWTDADTEQYIKEIQSLLIFFPTLKDSPSLLEEVARRAVLTNPGRTDTEINPVSALNDMFGNEKVRESAKRLLIQNIQGGSITHWSDQNPISHVRNVLNFFPELRSDEDICAAVKERVKAGLLKYGYLDGPFDLTGHSSNLRWREVLPDIDLYSDPEMRNIMILKALKDAEEKTLESFLYSLSDYPPSIIQDVSVQSILKSKFIGLLIEDSDSRFLKSIETYIPTQKILEDESINEIITSLIQQYARNGNVSSLRRLEELFPSRDLWPKIRDEFVSLLPRHSIPPNLLEGREWDFSHLPAQDGTPDQAVYDRVKKVANNDLRRKLWEALLGREGIRIVRNEDYEREKNYAHVPPHLFGALYAQGLGSKVLYEALEKECSAIAGKKGETTTLQHLEHTITTIAYECDDDARAVFTDDLPRILMTHPPEHGELFNFLEKFSATLALEKALKNMRSSADDYEYHDEHEEEAVQEAIPKEEGPEEKGVLRTLAEHAKTLEEFTQACKERVSETLSKLLGVRPTPEQFERVQQEWGELRSIFVLAGKYGSGYQEGLPLFREALSVVFENRWHAFRYDLANHLVKKQIGHCTPEERMSWIKNAEPQTLEEVRIARVNPERRRTVITQHLRTGLDQGHLTTYQIPETSAQHDLSVLLRKILDSETSVKDLEGERLIIGVIMGERTFLKGSLRTIGETNPPKNEEEIRAMRAKTESALQPLASLATDVMTKKQKADRDNMERLLRWLDDRAQLGDRYEKLKETIGVTDQMAMKDLATRRTDVDLAAKIGKIATLTDDELRLLSLRDKDGNFKTKALRATLENIRTTLVERKSAFAQDIQNIIDALYKTAAVPESLQGLTIQEEDHPKTLFETGHYPLGSGSCQNYEGDVGYNRCLLAYVTDADKKIITVRKPDRTIVARAIIKLGAIGEEKAPAIFIEPTYTSVNKGDHDFDRDIDRYIKRKARTMGKRVLALRGAHDGEVRVKIAASRNGVQYEDGGAGAADNAGLGTQNGSYSMGAYEVGTRTIRAGREAELATV